MHCVSLKSLSVAREIQRVVVTGEYSNVFEEKKGTRKASSE